jgi:thiosulfate dehydrogenase
MKSKPLSTTTIFFGSCLDLVVFGVMVAFVFSSCSNSESKLSPIDTTEQVWYGWNHYQLKETDSLERYGYNLIANTAYYWGPKGKLEQLSNGMNCQNCHLEAGIIPWGNNYSAVASTYPKFRERRGGMESMEKRVNDCIERSLNGKPIDSASKEMRAIVGYMKWLGKEIPKGKKPKGSGIMDLAFLERAADPTKGKHVFTISCQRCHGVNGEGQLNLEGYGYTYPPVWGKNSFNTGAGLYRLSKLAGYIKNNMPFNETSYLNPVLTDEEAWDVAAFIASQPRPAKDLSKDWPRLSTKPFDHPFGPYTDTFNVQQHKYGPFAAIVEARKKK